MRLDYSEDGGRGRIGSDPVGMLLAAPLYVLGYALYFLRPLVAGLIAPFRSAVTVRRRVGKP